MHKKTGAFALPLAALLLAAFAITTPLAHSEHPSPAQQIRDGVDPYDIQCNAERIHVIRDNDAHICVRDTTAQKFGWEPVIFTTLSVSSPEEFVDDGREIKRSVLQKAPAPAPWYDTIMSSQMNPGNMGSNNTVRTPSTPHEKYSVVPGVGFYIEDWMPTHILDGQKLLYADNGCYPSGNCYLNMQFVPTSFVLNENVTNHDLDVSKGFTVNIKYSTVQLEEMEDRIEHKKEIIEAQPGNYGEGFREITRDTKIVFAYQGGNNLNHYQAGIGYNFNERIRIGVHSYYHTLDELLPVFNSIGN